MTDADKERSPKDESKRLLKVAATYSPTTQCSTIGDAVSRCCPRPSASPLSAPLSPAPARRRRAQPTPRMAHTAPHSATPLTPKNLPIPPDYIKDMVSLK